MRAGMNKITGDITKMAAQVPALFETLSGMPLSELLGKVRQIGDKAPKTGRCAESVARGAGTGRGSFPPFGFRLSRNRSSQSPEAGEAEAFRSRL